MLSVFRRRPFVFELRDLWPASIKAVGAMKESRTLRMLERLEMFLYRRATAIVSVTNAFKDELIARGIDGGKIAVVINGVDLQRYAPRDKDQALAREYQLENKFVVGYIGTHGMAHALHRVLEAADLVARPWRDHLSSGRQWGAAGGTGEAGTGNGVGKCVLHPATGEGTDAFRMEPV